MEQDKIEIVAVFRNIKKTLFSFVLTNVKMKDEITDEFKSLLLKLWLLGKSKVVKRRTSLIFFTKFEVPNGRFSVGETIYKIKQPFQFIEEDPSLIIESSDTSFPERLKSKLKDKIILKEPLTIKRSNRNNFIENIEVETPTKFVDDEVTTLPIEHKGLKLEKTEVRAESTITKEELKVKIEGKEESVEVVINKSCYKLEGVDCIIEPKFRNEVIDNIKMLKEINFLEEGKFVVKRTSQFYYAVMDTKCGHAWGDVLTNRSGQSQLYNGKHLNTTRLNFFQLYYL